MADNSQYDPKKIEPKWQKAWEERRLFEARDFDKKKKFYILIEFPYPSGAGLHVGHVRSWSAMDAYARIRRLMGYNVLYPIGWDAFGLPAENYAIKTGTHPSKIVAQNIAYFKDQIKRLGLSFDWSREINTTDPAYYKWTQWIFLQFLKHGLAYRAQVPVNWCPSCKTNLADEEVNPDGTHERCGTQTEKRLQRQWLLSITKYADRLIEDLRLVDYPPLVAQQQINWIGRKEGINISYPVEGLDYELVCFTTRPDTNFGATFIAISPEHPLVEKILAGKLAKEKREEIEAYIAAFKKKTSIKRLAEAGRKTGVKTPFSAVNRLNNKRLEIWISDFVLSEVGTGAVVGVPAHDRRDYEFAKAYDLPIVQVVRPAGKADFSLPYEGEGIVLNSDFLTGLSTGEAREKIMDYLEEKGWGKRSLVYHLRDWIFSRQHYWGEPIPVVYCANCAKRKPADSPVNLLETINGVEYAIVPVPEKDLPVLLPYVEKYEPAGTGESPLSQISSWVNTNCPVCGGAARRETDTMPNWAGSNWYFLRYLDPHNEKALADRAKMEYYMPVDIYQGGIEHTTLHLLYSRFVYKFLYDIGVVPTREPYAKRRVHGIVLGPDGRKMSKSFGNVVNPDEIANKYGADTLRVYEMFMGPFSQTIAWSEEGVEGCYRFLRRVFDTCLKKTTSKSDKALLSLLHKTIDKVSRDVEQLKFNTAIASLMEFRNAWQEAEGGLSVEHTEKFLLLLYPFAPHIAEELWLRINKGDFSSWQDLLATKTWPSSDKRLLVEEEATIVVQVNSRVREILNISSEKANDKEFVENQAKSLTNIRKYLEGKKIQKTVFVPGKVLNFVTA
jgi:leucyl-tRNA synthetase